jgi:hypothetical protein
LRFRRPRARRPTPIRDTVTGSGTNVWEKVLDPFTSLKIQSTAFGEIEIFAKLLPAVTLPVPNRVPPTPLQEEPKVICLEQMLSVMLVPVAIFRRILETPGLTRNSTSISCPLPRVSLKVTRPLGLKFAVIEKGVELGKPVPIKTEKLSNVKPFSVQGSPAEPVSV